MKKYLFVGAVLFSICNFPIAFADEAKVEEWNAFDNVTQSDVKWQAPPKVSFWKKIGKDFKFIGRDMGKGLTFTGRTVGYGLKDVSNLSTGISNYAYGTFRSLDGKPHDIKADLHDKHYAAMAGSAVGSLVVTSRIVPSHPIAGAVIIASDVTDLVLCRKASNSPKYCENVANGLDFGKVPAKGMKSGQKLGAGISAFFGREWHFLFGHKKKKPVEQEAAVSEVQQKAPEKSPEPSIGQGANTIADGDNGFAASPAIPAAPSASAQDVAI